MTKGKEYLLGKRGRIIKDIIIKLLRLELGKLYQHKPKKLYIESFPESKEDKYYKISIVTPSYNQGRFIERTIKSVVDQNYPNLEYIVKDGGSKDQTKKIINNYRSRFAYCESGTDKGQTNAINIGFSQSTGEIMAYLNSDDMLMPESLRFVNDYFRNHPNADVIYGHRVIVDENDMQVGRWILAPHSNKVLSYVDFVPQETLFWRKRAWVKTGGFLDESLRFAMDWDLLMRFMQSGAKIVRVPYVLGMFRFHNRQKTQSIISTGKKEKFKISNKYNKNETVEKKTRYITIISYILYSAFVSLLFNRGIRI